ncbi:MAG: hypothetical protein M1814_003130 [Vezdaea aestivalis]|nr:MAG: hypothetical protein M1814_003130 [Vezdaea aestivalis]
MERSQASFKAQVPSEPPESSLEPSRPGAGVDAAAAEPETSARLSTNTLSSQANLRRNSTSKDGKAAAADESLAAIDPLSRKEITIQTTDDDESEFGEKRIEGMDAHVFSQPLGFIPKFPEPPKYIKVRSHNKKARDFNRLFLAQELQWDQTSGNQNGNGAQKTAPSAKSDGSPIWTMEFSIDGEYLAAAGVDINIRIWKVLSSKKERTASEADEAVRSAGGEESGQRLEAPVFDSRPSRLLKGHTQAVLSLSWSRNKFLLSSSMDRTVRLWHANHEECLVVFKHSDFVTSISFHPVDDRFFLAGSLDSKLRLWSIPDKTVVYYTILPAIITSVAFTPDGKTAIAGCLNGNCLFYDTDGLKYTTQIHVRSTHGRNAKGSKITGIRTLKVPPDSQDGEIKLLITSNDSRIRLYNFKDKALEMKFRGNENTANQIHARFSEDAKFVICGSEDHKAYIWSTGPGEGEKKDKRPVELFEAHKATVTAAIMAPIATRKFLSLSGDPVYDLCNPPKVTLTSRNDSSKAPTETNTLNSDAASSLPPESPLRKGPTSEPLQSDSWTARSGHADGNIIVTSDSQGKIKVFRQDCAFNKRRNDSWETGSTFSKRVNTSIFSRSSTFAARNNSQSRRDSGSFVQNQPSDRILMWRNSIGSSNASFDSSFRNGSLRSATKPVSLRNRSTSPRKASVGQLSQRTLESGVEVPLPTPNRYAPSVSTTSPPPSIRMTSPNGEISSGVPPKVFVSPDDPMMIQSTGQSFAFYNTANWHTVNQDEEPDASHLAPLEKGVSRLSTLSDEDSSLAEDEEEDTQICKKCGGGKFKMTGIRGVGQGRRAVCQRCGLAAPT